MRLSRPVPSDLRLVVCARSKRRSPGEKVSCGAVVTGGGGGLGGAALKVVRLYLTPMPRSAKESFSKEKMSSTLSWLKTMFPQIAKRDSIVVVVPVPPPPVTGVSCKKEN